MKGMIFHYHGEEYRVCRAFALPGEGNLELYKILTADNKEFLMSYNQIIHQWVVRSAAGEPGFDSV